MKDKVVILAGGEGNRLRPLTAVMPKPLVRVANRPMLEYMQDALVRAGYFNHNIATQYMAPPLEAYFNSGSRFAYGDNRLHCSYVRPLKKGGTFTGTANALKQGRLFFADKISAVDIETQERREISVRDFFENKASYRDPVPVEHYENLIVVPGDVITDIDIEKLMQFHRSHEGFATIALCKKPKDRIVKKLGVVALKESGEVEQFYEKPRTLEEVPSDLANTGIYIFRRAVLDELERSGTWNDFGNDVFPGLLELSRRDRDYAIFGCAAETQNGRDPYWNDVGEIEDYFATNMQLIRGVPGIDTSSKQQRDHRTTRIIGTAINSIVEGAEIETGATVIGCVIDEGVTIGRNARLENCIIMPDVKVEPDVVLRNIIIDEGAHIYPSEIGEMTVIGSNATVHANVRIMPGARISPGSDLRKNVEEDTSG